MIRLFGTGASTGVNHCRSIDFSGAVLIYVCWESGPLRSAAVEEMMAPLKEASAVECVFNSPRRVYVAYSVMCCQYFNKGRPQKFPLLACNKLCILVGGGVIAQREGKYGMYSFAFPLKQNHFLINRQGGNTALQTNLYSVALDWERVNSEVLSSSLY